MLYFFFAVSALLSPSITQITGERLQMFIGSTLYAALVLSLCIGNNVFFIIGSALCGIGSGLLWVGQGIWLTLIARGDPANLGYLTGIFFFGFGANQAVGNLLSIILLQFLSPNQMLWCLFGVTTLGISFFFNNSPKTRHKKKKKEQSSSPALGLHIKMIAKNLKVMSG